MRPVLAFAAGAAAVLALPAMATAQNADRLNPVIAVQEKGLPIFGISHPAIVRRGPGGPGGPPRGPNGAPNGAPAPAPATPAAPMPEIVLSDVAKETVGYKRADFLFTSAANETFYRYLDEIKKAGGSARTHPFSSKIGIFHKDPAAGQQAIIRQLNAGLVNVSAEEVSSAQEVRDVLKAMRFASAGGTRPDTGLAAAASYWGLTVDQYKQRADVWPLNKKGELFLTLIIESKEGVAKAREIAAVPGIGQIFVGYGTLGGVYRDDPAGREKASLEILAACKEYKIPCGFPVNNPAEMEQRMKEGWTVFIMQRRDENGMGAIETGRKLSGR
ncbi:MAG TPA: aldolase/citrate lyase family protein [Gemmatimonas sp.]|uniref:aldolase/citrate lyase family protein n=1 Tax=Gemmatimonas sp. TaxID=1962908 RepID=UPI002ED8DA5C